MLILCKEKNKIPVFYANVIAFEARANAGLHHCSVGSYNLCAKGADYIRKNREKLVNKYKENAKNIADTYGSNEMVVFLIEPDFW